MVYKKSTVLLCNITLDKKYKDKTKPFSSLQIYMRYLYKNQIDIVISLSAYKKIIVAIWEKMNYNTLATV